MPGFVGARRLNGLQRWGNLPSCLATVLSPQRAEGSKRLEMGLLTQQSGHSRRLVLCCDEKSQCQALERTQPGLPLGIGHIRTKTHDYVRHGTLTLFAALNYLEGKLITPFGAAPPASGVARLSQNHR